MGKKILLVLIFWLLSAVALAAVNINTADVQELTSLPGIGPVKAEAIVDYRTKNGEFTTLDDLEKVKGIGPKIREKLEGEVTLGEEKGAKE